MKLFTRRGEWRRQGKGERIREERRVENKTVSFLYCTNIFMWHVDRQRIKKNY